MCWLAIARRAERAPAVLIGGEATITGTDHGKPFTEHFHYADIFEHRDGRWQVVYTQVTPVKA